MRWPWTKKTEPSMKAGQSAGWKMDGPASDCVLVTLLFGAVRGRLDAVVVTSIRVNEIMLLTAHRHSGMHRPTNCHAGR